MALKFTTPKSSTLASSALKSSKAGALCMAAALSMAVTPAQAAELPKAPTSGSSYAFIEGFSTSSFDSESDVSEWRRCRWRGCWRRGWRGRRGVRAGDVIAGVAILGGIAAIASAANNNRRRDREVVVVERDRPRDYDDRRYEDRRYDDRRYDDRRSDDRQWDRERYERERERMEAERDQRERENDLQREFQRDRDIEDLRRRIEEQDREIEELRRREMSATTPAPANPPVDRGVRAPTRVPTPLPAPAPSNRGSTQTISLDGAVERCSEVLAIDNNVSKVDGAVRTNDGYSVRGRLSNGETFTCRVNREGQITSLENGNFAQNSVEPISATRSDGQWSDDRYADARARADRTFVARYDTADRPEQPLVALTSDRMPAYPGGPVPTE